MPLIFKNYAEFILLLKNSMLYDKCNVTAKMCNVSTFYTAISRCKQRGINMKKQRRFPVR